jgi:hypothetical protein
MGKKDGKRKRVESDDEEDVDPELEAEMAALAAMRAEKDAKQIGAVEAGEESAERPKNLYNKEGLLQAIESLGSLPFIESLQLSEFAVDVHDENDDLEREVHFFVERLMKFNNSVLVMLSLLSYRYTVDCIL